MNLSFLVKQMNTGLLCAFLISLLFYPVANLQAQEKMVITGTVMDNTDNKGIPDVSVSIEGRGTRTTTNAEGRYSIEAVKGSVLVFSSVGYDTKKEVVGNARTINVSLSIAAKLLDETVIIGYGSSTKKEITGSVATIKSKDFNKGVFTDAIGLLQGKVAGLTISKPDGADPLATFKIILRGTNTLSSGQGPLIIIDGVAGADLRNVNFEEVISFDVLKDGAAAAIYGTRGTNGVIIISTKRARSGKTALEFSTQLTAQVSPQYVESLNAEEFKYAIENYMPGRVGSLYGAQTDWFSEITRKNPLSQRYSLAMSGGSEAFSHRTTFNIEQNNGLLKDNKVNKYLVKTNLKQSAFKDRLSMDYNMSIRMSQYNPANYDLFKQAFTQNPTQPVYDDKNIAGGGYSQLQALEYYNPVAMMNERSREAKTYVIAPNVTATLKLFKGLSWTNFLSYEVGTNKETSYKTKYYPTIIGRGGEAEISNSDNFNLQYESVGNYKTSWGLHNLQAVAGYSYQKVGYSSSSMSNSGFDTDIYGPNNIGAGAALQAGTSGMSSYRSESKLISFFGRVVYNYNQKYMASISLRREGSSKFGNNNKWGYFPAASLGWKLDQEDFMKDVSWIDDLKLRIGYGVTGNQDFSSYKSQILFGRAGRFYYNGEWINTYQPVSNPNPDLRWEKKQELNFGIDFSLFKNKINGSIDAYSRTSTDLLYSYNVSVPPYLYKDLFTNVGDISNRGIELSLNGNLMKRKNFEWNSILTFSKNINKLIRISNAEFKETHYDVAYLKGAFPFSTQRVQEGKSLGTFYGPVWRGVDEFGYDKFKYQTPIGAADPNKLEDIGNANPFCMIGFSNSLTYKNWDLNFALRSNIGGKVLNVYRVYYENWASIGTTNIVRSQLENPTFIGNTTYSSKYIEDATFVKMDNVSLSYKVPVIAEWFSSLLISFTAQNVFTITKYKGLDPEVSLSGLEPGMDNLSYYPRTTTLALGFNVIF